MDVCRYLPIARNSKKGVLSMLRKFRLARCLGILYLASALVAGMATRGDDKVSDKGVDAKTAFARIKSLAGTWNCRISGAHQADDHKDKGDHNPSDSTVVYRLTGAGSALVETQFPGSDHEMVSVYHLDGDELRMTHYCAAGNQPRVKLDRASSTPTHLIFVFDGGSNLDAQKDMHIHGLEITFHADGKVTSDWEAYTGGKSAGKTSFAMSKQ
jgi:hypothetical protein